MHGAAMAGRARRNLPTGLGTERTGPSLCQQHNPTPRLLGWASLDMVVRQAFPARAQCVVGVHELADRVRWRGALLRREQVGL